MNSKKNSKKTEPIVLAFAVALPTVVTLIYFVLLSSSSAATQKIAYGIGKAIQFSLPVVWVWLFCSEKLTSLLPWANGGFDGRTSPKLTKIQASGLAVGFGFLVAASVFAGFYLIVKPLGLADMLIAKILEKTSGMSLDLPWKFALLGVFYTVVHSFLEEYYWRWFVFKRLLSHTPLWIAVAVSSLGFMAHHVVLMTTFLGWDSPLAYLISAMVAIGGAFWAVLYRNSRKLIYPWLSHMIVDAAIFALGYMLLFG